MVQFLQQNVPNAGQLKIWSMREKNVGHKKLQKGKKATNSMYAAICN